MPLGDGFAFGGRAIIEVRPVPAEGDHQEGSATPPPSLNAEAGRGDPTPAMEGGGAQCLATILPAMQPSARLNYTEPTRRGSVAEPASAGEDPPPPYPGPPLPQIEPEPEKPKRTRRERKLALWERLKQALAETDDEESETEDGNRREPASERDPLPHQDGGRVGTASPEPDASRPRSRTRSRTPDARRRADRSESPADRSRANSADSRSSVISSASTDWTLLDQESENDARGRSPPPGEIDGCVDVPPDVDIDHMLPPTLQAWQEEASVYADHGLPLPPVVTLDGVRRMSFGKCRRTRRRDGRINKYVAERRFVACTSSLYDSLECAMRAWRRTHRGWKASHAAYLKLKNDRQATYRIAVNANLRLRLAEAETEITDWRARYGAIRDQLDDVNRAARRRLDEIRQANPPAGTQDPIQPLPEELIRPWPAIPREPRDRRSRRRFYAEVSEAIMEKTSMLFALARAERNNERDRDAGFAEIGMDLYRHLCRMTGNPPRNPDPFAVYPRPPPPPPARWVPPPGQQFGPPAAVARYMPNQQVAGPDHQEGPGPRRDHQEGPVFRGDHQEGPGPRTDHQEGPALRRDHQEGPASGRGNVTLNPVDEEDENVDVNTEEEEDDNYSDDEEEYPPTHFL